tara:strand:- start:68 stop:418 length:351 start_codon:yes stop_codon:yes gene_type:complete
MSKDNMKELQKVVTQMSLNILRIQNDLRNFVREQEDINAELKQQINRRPVDMTQMRDELFDDVNEQISWRLSQKVSEFDGVVNNFFANARFTPDAKVSDQFDTDVRVDKNKGENCE